MRCFPSMFLSSYPVSDFSDCAPPDEIHIFWFLFTWIFVSLGSHLKLIIPVNQLSPSFKFCKTFLVTTECQL